MDCPYLMIKEQSKTCKRMLADGLDGEVAEFDVEHYCRGNPACCYYFRMHTEPCDKDTRNGRNRANNHLRVASQIV